MTPQPDHEAHLPSATVRIWWRRGTALLGLAMLFSGYALLAVSPDTPGDWVLIRVAAGFLLLFIGFAIAIVPLLSRTLNGWE